MTTSVVFVVTQGASCGPNVFLRGIVAISDSALSFGKCAPLVSLRVKWRSFPKPHFAYELCLSSFS
jgi:hypothetical protein